MKQVITLLIKNEEINKLRKKYYSAYKKFKTHLTLVYPFEVNNQTALFEHIFSSINKIKPFKIDFGKFYASNNFVCLAVESKGCWKLYNKLNRAILAGFENKEVKFRPHITITVLRTTREARALVKKLNRSQLTDRVSINLIYLLTLNKDHSIKSKKGFRFS